MSTRVKRCHREQPPPHVLLGRKKFSVQGGGRCGLFIRQFASMSSREFLTRIDKTTQLTSTRTINIAIVLGNTIESFCIFTKIELVVLVIIISFYSNMRLQNFLSPNNLVSGEINFKNTNDYCYLCLADIGRQLNIRILLIQLF